jgi:hypothetical protein
MSGIARILRLDHRPSRAFAVSYRSAASAMCAAPLLDQRCLSSASAFLSGARCSPAITSTTRVAGNRRRRSVWCSVRCESTHPIPGSGVRSDVILRATAAGLDLGLGRPGRHRAPMAAGVRPQGKRRGARRSSPEDIQQNGLQTPIAIMEIDGFDVVVGGRNRREACRGAASTIRPSIASTPPRTPSRSSRRATSTGATSRRGSGR